MHDDQRPTSRAAVSRRRRGAVAALGAAALLAASTAHAQSRPARSRREPRPRPRPARAANADAPRYRYDPTWPKLPLPNGWTFEGITGLFVDSDDVVWVLNRPRDFDADATENYAGIEKPSARCCKKPPAVLAFDVAGNLVHAWGDPAKVPGWPGSEHTILVDRAGHVWIGGATAGDTLLKFTKDGELARRLRPSRPRRESRATRSRTTSRRICCCAASRRPSSTRTRARSTSRTAI